MQLVEYGERSFKCRYLCSLHPPTMSFASRDIDWSASPTQSTSSFLSNVAEIGAPTIYTGPSGDDATLRRHLSQCHEDIRRFLSALDLQRCNLGCRADAFTIIVINSDAQHPKVAPGAVYTFRLQAITLTPVERVQLGVMPRWEKPPSHVRYCSTGRLIWGENVRISSSTAAEHTEFTMKLE